MSVKNKCVIRLERTQGPAYSRWPSLTRRTHSTHAVLRNWGGGERKEAEKESQLKKYDK